MQKNIKIFNTTLLALVVAGALAFPAFAQDKNDASELSFSIAPPLQDCAELPNDVVGLQSAIQPKPANNIVTRFLEHDRIARAIASIERRKEAMTRKILHEKSYNVRLKYSIPDAPRGKAIQDISLELPEDFHKRATYELSCHVAKTKSDTIVYRKFSPKMFNQNIDEPPVSLLPRDCITTDGEVNIRITDYRSLKSATAELKSSIFRATFWDPKSRYKDHADLEVFVPKVSYAPGERISFHAHASNEDMPATLEIVRAGQSAKVWKNFENLHVRSQKISSYFYRDGVDWPALLQFDIPRDTPTGYYVAVLHQGDERAAFPFVIRPAAGDATPIAIIAATNTWQAYNGWNNASLYKNQIGKKCLAEIYTPMVSTRRPTNLPYPLGDATEDDHLFRAEREIAAWLEKSHVKYAVYTEDDLHSDPHLLDKHAIALLPSHPEYYTTEMYDSLQRHVEHGGGLMYLGGNALYYRVTRVGEHLEKQPAGQRHEDDGQFGGAWSAHLNRSPASLLGVEYDARDYGTHAPYVVKKSDSPVFAGTNLKNGDSIGTKASGHEIDVMSSKSPANTILLAKGSNPAGYGADMVIFDNPSGGQTFSVGSIAFSYDLDKDPNMGIILNNVIKMMLASQTAKHP